VTLDTRATPWVSWSVPWVQVLTQFCVAAARLCLTDGPIVRLHAALLTLPSLCLTSWPFLLPLLARLFNRHQLHTSCHRGFLSPSHFKLSIKGSTKTTSPDLTVVCLCCLPLVFIHGLNIRPIRLLSEHRTPLSDV
jgi:hypothetical protein